MEMFEPIAALGSAWVFVINLFCTIVGGLLAIFIIDKVIRRALKRNNHVDDAIVTFIINANKVCCLIIIAAIVLQLFGVKAATIITVLGAAGAAAALALRDSLANVVGGFMIILTHPFVQGDLISVNGDRGKVQSIDLLLTTLKTLDYKTITIPNGIINTSVIYNETRENIRRVDVQFNVAYSNDIEEVKEIIHNVCSASELILKDPEPCIGMLKSDDGGAVIDCLAYCKTSDRYDVQYYLNETMKQAFEEANIEIAYPIVNVKKSK